MKYIELEVTQLTNKGGNYCYGVITESLDNIFKACEYEFGEVNTRNENNELILDYTNIKIICEDR